MTNFTFSDRGFDEVQNIAKVETDEETKTLLPVTIKRTKQPIFKKFLIPTLTKYVQQKEIRHKEVGFVGAIAYFMDGRVEYAYNDSTKLQCVVTGGAYEPEFYKSDRCPEGYLNNAEYVRDKFMSKNPEGLMLYQEIPGDEENYKFRVIHDSPDDRIVEGRDYGSPKGKTRKKMELLECAAEYLQIYNGRETLKEEEIGEIMAIFTLMTALDPNGRYVDMTDERILGVGEHPLGRGKKEGKKKGSEGANVIQFPGK